MIAPDVRIEDLEPEGFAYLCGLLARRDRTPPHHLQVLHDAGRVLRVVDVRSGPVEGYREPVTDPAARAAELLDETAAERVTLIDRARIGDLAQQVNAAAGPDRTQPELLWASNEAFWAHPGVVTAPAPPPSAWPQLARGLRELGDDYRAVLGVWRGDRLFASLVADVRGGAAVRITSVDGMGWPRPERSDATQLIGHDPDVRLAFLCDAELLEQIVSAGDPRDAILRAVDEGRPIDHRGIRKALCGPST